MRTDPAHDARHEDAYSPYLESIMDNSPLCFLVLDRHGRIEFANPRLADALGLPPDRPDFPGRLSMRHLTPFRTRRNQAHGQTGGSRQSTGRMAFEWLQPCAPAGSAPYPDAAGEPEALPAILNRILKGENWSGELMLRSRDGTLNRRHAMLSPLCDGHGRPARVLGVLQPVAGKVDTYRRNTGTEPPLLNRAHGLRQAGGDAARYEQQLIHYLALYENAAEDLRTLLRQTDPAQSLVYLGRLADHSQAIGCERMGILASRLCEMIESPTGRVPASMVAIYENLALSLQNAIQDGSHDRKTRPTEEIALQPAGQAQSGHPDTQEPLTAGAAGAVGAAGMAAR